jgi:hypothetical protein
MRRLEQLTVAKEEEIWRILGECVDRKDGRAKSI